MGQAGVGSFLTVVTFTTVSQEQMRSICIHSLIQPQGKKHLQSAICLGSGDAVMTKHTGGKADTSEHTNCWKCKYKYGVRDTKGDLFSTGRSGGPSEEF